MRDKLAVLLVEQGEDVSVQLFEDPDNAYESFKEFKGKVYDVPRRATFLDLRVEGGTVRVNRSESRILPEASLSDTDGFRLGEGPVKFDKGEAHEEHAGSN